MQNLIQKGEDIRAWNSRMNSKHSHSNRKATRRGHSQCPTPLETSHPASPPSPSRSASCETWNPSEKKPSKTLKNSQTQIKERAREHYTKKGRWCGWWRCPRRRWGQAGKKRVNRRGERGRGRRGRRSIRPCHFPASRRRRRSRVSRTSGAPWGRIGGGDPTLGWRRRRRRRRWRRRRRRGGGGGETRETSSDGQRFHLRNQNKAFVYIIYIYLYWKLNLIQVPEIFFSGKETLIILKKSTDF